MKNLEIHFVIYCCALVCSPGCRDTFACRTELSFFLGDLGKAAITSEIFPHFTSYRFEFALSEEEKLKYTEGKNKRKKRSNFSLMSRLCWNCNL